MPSLNTIESGSRKRFSASSHETQTTPKTKRQRMSDDGQHGSLRVQYAQKIPPQGDASQFDHQQIGQMLDSAVTISLTRAGFSGATAPSVTAIRCAAEEFMLHLSIQVSRCQILCRRNHPLPQDFSFALHLERISCTELLDHHLKSAVFPRHRLPTFRIQDRIPLAEPSSGFLATENEDHLQIPGFSAALPPKHTYQATESWSTRVADHAGLAQKATEQGRMAQTALENILQAQTATMSSQQADHTSEQEADFPNIAELGLFRREKARLALMRELASKREAGQDGVGPMIHWEQQYHRPP